MVRLNRLLSIPDDWIEEDGYEILFLCVPKSRKWRGTITALLSLLEYGRTWDENTGNIKATQAIAREILATMAICDIGEFFERQAIALETMAIRLLAIEQKMPPLVTLQELLDDLENSTLVELVPYLETFLALKDLIPNIDLQFKVTDVLAFITDSYWKRRVALAIEGINRKQLISNLIEGGETVAETVQTIDEIADTTLDVVNTFIGGLGSTGEMLQALIALYELFAQPGADENPELRTSVRNVITMVINACCNNTPELPKYNPSTTFVPEDDQFEGVASGNPPRNTNSITYSATPNTTAQKCENAWYIWYGVQQYLYFFRSKLPDTRVSLPSALAILTACFIAMSIPIAMPIAALIAMATIAAGYSYSALITTVLTNIINVLEAKDEEIVCAMVNGTTVGLAKASVKNIFNEDLTEIEASAAMLFFNNTNLANLFYEGSNFNRANIPSPLPSDCTDCSGDCVFDLQYGTNLGSANFASERLVPTANNHTIRFDFIDCPNQLITIDSWEWTGTPGNTLEVKWNLPNGSVMNQWLHLATLPQTYEVHGGSIFWLTSSNAPSGAQHPFEAHIVAVEL